MAERTFSVVLPLEQGGDVKVIPAQFVKPFVKSNKNDFIDAEAIAEAVDRQNMRFVPIKTDDQLDLQAVHRVRDRLISRRTAVINQLRAFLLKSATPAPVTCAALISRFAVESIWADVILCSSGRATARCCAPEVAITTSERTGK